MTIHLPSIFPNSLSNYSLFGLSDSSFLLFFLAKGSHYQVLIGLE